MASRLEARTMREDKILEAHSEVVYQVRDVLS